MYKPVITGVLLSLGFLAPQNAKLPWRESPFQKPPMLLKEEAMILEFTASGNEAVIVVQAESEVCLQRVEVRDPNGQSVLKLRSEERKGLGLSGFVVELRETEPAVLFDTYTAGIYTISGRAADGRPIRGSALLSHDLLPAPTVIYPAEDSVDIPTSNLDVSWFPDPKATGYRVVLEQGENDGLVVELPAGTGSFQVPAGVLAPDTESQLEVGAIGPNGNCTLVEVCFRTR